ncbi:hypothetical protein C8J57DRAFT_1465420 [Mycena rebaudengoi]|nr:hypothetical protein C8J57DRAFT_1465420 [Mycena rebaudengoi]
MPYAFPDVPKLSAIQFARDAATKLRDISSNVDVPFLRTIAGITLLILDIVQSVKSNKDRCFRMVEEIHQLLCVLGTLYLKLEYTMLPKLVNEIADLSQTLLKFYGCLRSEQELGKIKRFFKQSEITAQLEVCEVELKSALDVFRIQTGVGVTTALLQMSVDTEGRHQELLELIATRNDWVL